MIEHGYRICTLIQSTTRSTDVRTWSERKIQGCSTCRSVALLVGNVADGRRTELYIDRSFTTKFTVTSHCACHAFKVHPLLPPVYVSSPVTAWPTSRLYASWIGRGTGYLCHLVNGRQSIHPRTVTAPKGIPHVLIESYGLATTPSPRQVFT